MEPKNNPDVLHQLLGFLEREKAALMSGDFAALEAMLEEKEQLATQLRNGPGLNGSQLEDIRQKSQRNANLFDESLAGIRAAVARFSDTWAIRRELRTYDAKGQEVDLLQGETPNLEKRA